MKWALDELGEVTIYPIFTTWPICKRSNMRIRPFFLVSVESGRVVEEKWSRVLTSSRSTHAFCCCCWCCFLLHVSRDHDRRSSKLGAAATHFGKSRNFSLSNHSVTKSHENSFSDTYPGASSLKIFLGKFKVSSPLSSSQNWISFIRPKLEKPKNQSCT